ncbi:MAG: hypothetical protein WBA73_05795 [Devosia sp.]
MTDNELTQEELNTLALFQSSTQPIDIDPHHFAKLLSMALIEQKEGGPELTASGIARLNEAHL